MNKLRVRTYNVRFGDAILVTVPDRDPKTKKLESRSILIDLGNVLNKEGGDDSVFKPVVDDVIRELGGKPLDLYVMTHEHLDHVQGLYHYAVKHSTEEKLRKALNTQYAWLTASADPDYYTQFPDARKQKNLYLKAYDRIKAMLNRLPAAEAIALGALFANNDPRKTGECVDYLRKLAPKARTSYIFRGFDAKGHHPFKEVKFEIWAPEQDSNDYYRTLLPMAHLSEGDIGSSLDESFSPRPPSGVDAGSFYDLVDSRRNGFSDNMLAIDKAANNTSVVFSLEWRGYRLLFSGDAELGSWKKMQAAGVLKPVDFLKVSHHGSHNGTPADDILESYFPKAGGKPKRKAVISTWDQTYPGIPHSPTNARLTQRCTLHSILDDKNVPYIDSFIEA